MASGLGPYSNVSCNHQLLIFTSLLLIIDLFPFVPDSNGCAPQVIAATSRCLFVSSSVVDTMTMQQLSFIRQKWETGMSGALKLIPKHQAVGLAAPAPRRGSWLQVFRPGWAAFTDEVDVHSSTQCNRCY